MGIASHFFSVASFCVLLSVSCRAAIATDDSDGTIFDRIEQRFASIVPYEQIVLAKFPDADLTLNSRELERRIGIVAEKAEKLANEKFPDSARKKIEAEAAQTYKAVAIGEVVEVPVRHGRGYRMVKGPLRAVTNSFIVVGSNRIPLVDLTPEIAAKLDKERAASHAKSRVEAMFDHPKSEFAKAKRMEMERELNRIHRKSMEARHAVESGKDTYLAAERAKILQEMLPTHFEERLRLCSEESEIPEQLKRYAELVSEYRTVENRYGDVAAKILSTVVDVRHIESDVIPELEQKMSGERRTESHKMLFRPDALTKI